MKNSIDTSGSREARKNQSENSLNFCNAVIRCAVVPQNSPFVFYSNGQLQEALHCLWILCVHVRKVGGEDQAVITDEIDSVFYRLLVGFDGSIALSLEVLTRRVLELRRPLVTEHLPMLIEPP